MLDNQFKKKAGKKLNVQTGQERLSVVGQKWTTLLENYLLRAVMD